MSKDNPNFNERKFRSSELYTATLKDEHNEGGRWDFGGGSGISFYLSGITSDKGYYCHGNVSVKIKLDQDYRSFTIDKKKYHEQITLIWLLDSEEPSGLIKVITEKFGFEEIK